MRTLHDIKTQKSFLSDNWTSATVEHRWSTSGYGSSKIIDKNGNIIAKRSGCGYDRFGAVVGDMIESLFPNEVYKLAEKTRDKKAARKSYQPSSQFYGLFYNADTKKAWLDGACGSEQMIKVLNAIGYHLDRLHDIDRGTRTGSTVFHIVPVPRHRLKWLK